MINKITDAMSLKINDVFGDDFDIYTESVKQGFKEPCFFIVNVDATNDLFLGKRYYRETQFCIHYFPAHRELNVDCHDVAESLYECLEWLNVKGDLLRGTGLKHDVLDGVLNFYVKYNFFTAKTLDIIPMGALTQDINRR